MDKLKTDINGGYPWVLDDFRWHHDAERAFITELVRALNLENQNCRIIGVEITGSGANQDVSEGYLLIDGEIIKVDAHTVPNLDLGSDYRHVVVATQYDPAGLKNLEDGGAANAYEQRRATIQTGNLPEGSDVIFNSTEFPLLSEVIAGALGDFTSPWTIVGFGSITGAGAGVNSFVGGAFKYKKIGRVVHIMCDLTVDIAASGSVIEFDIPAGFDIGETQKPGYVQLIDGSGGSAALLTFDDSTTKVKVIKQSSLVATTFGEVNFTCILKVQP